MIMKKKLAISITSVSKIYLVHHEKPTFSEQLFHPAQKKYFTALTNFSLDIYKNEKVGIIGRNGAGKTTLLKIITGITTPTAGKVKTAGKIVSLIDLNAGFHQDLTGEENIYLNGLVIGMSRQEIKQKISKIIEFADIGNFIDAPLYTYSQGMRLRLGFSVAIHADPDILILDEGLAVGDKDFQQKVNKKIKEFFAQNKTILVASHQYDFLKKNCKRFIWIEGGNIREDGKLSVFDHYMKSFKQK
jgi:ABC-type polysaccharide/polyol phosphate transport system ATPase subunit